MILVTLVKTSLMTSVTYRMFSRDRGRMKMAMG